MKKLLNVKPRSGRAASKPRRTLEDLWTTKMKEMESHLEEARTRHFGIGAEAAVYVRDGRTSAGFWVDAECTARAEFEIGRVVHGRPMAIVRVKALKS